MHLGDDQTFVEPNWINVDCHDKVIPLIICMQNKNHGTNMSDINVKKSVVCRNVSFSVKGLCFLYIWRWNMSLKTYKAMIHSTSRATLGELKLAKILFQHIAASFPVLLTQEKLISTVFDLLVCNKLHDVHTCTLHKVSRPPAKGYQVFKMKHEFIFRASNVFSCLSGGAIMLHSRCDGKVDCPDDVSDEDNCDLLRNKRVRDDRNNLQNGTNCGPLFHSTASGKCVRYLSFRRVLANKRQNDHFPSCTKESLRNDLVVDWDFEWNESKDWMPSEEGDLIRLVQGYESSCAHPMELPCRDGHSKCFNISHICSFLISGCGHTWPCRNGGHLQNCTDFECDKTFKCRNSYCIPWTYVCDSKWDCLDGEDETFGPVCIKTQAICLNMFKCWNADTCVYLGSVCDGLKDCPSGDDELLCELIHIACPNTCDCLALAISCHMDHTELLHSPYLAISITFAPRTTLLLKKFTAVLYLLIHHSNISELTDEWSQSLLHLELGHNTLRTISGSCFLTPVELQNLLLSHNKLDTLSSESFQKLHKLIFVDISSNPFVNYPVNMFLNSSHLKFLSMTSITLMSVDPDAFTTVKPKIIQTSDYQICCVVPRESFCSLPIPWFKSCSKLLEKNVILIVFITIFCINIVTNIASVIFHAVGLKKSNAAQTVSVFALNLGNLSLSLCFAIWWISDLVYGWKFPVRDTVWRIGQTCFSILGIYLCFSLTTKVFINLLSLSRMMVVVYPFDSNFERVSFVLKVITNCSILSTVISLLAVFITMFVSGELSSKYCVLVFNPTVSTFSTFLLWIFITLKFLSTCFVLCSHIVTIVKSKKSELKVNKAENQDTFVMTIQLVLIFISVAICWLSIDAIYITTAFVSSYPLELIPWTLAIIVPFNSIVFPVILIAFILRRFLKERNKMAIKAMKT